MGYIKQVSEAVSMEDVIRYYARDKKIIGRQFSCPFHGEDVHPSAVIMPDNRWRCFTCNEHGDAVDFVAKMFGCSLMEAANRLNEDFNLGLSSSTCCTPAEMTKERQEVDRKKAYKEKLEKSYLEYAERLRDYQVAITRYEPKNPQELAHPDPRYVMAIKNIDFLKYRMDEIDDKLFSLKRNPQK